MVSSRNDQATPEDKSQVTYESACFPNGEFATENEYCANLLADGVVGGAIRAEVRVWARSTLSEQVLLVRRVDSSG